MVAMIFIYGLLTSSTFEAPATFTTKNKSVFLQPYNEI